MFGDASYFDKKNGLTQTFGTNKAKSKMNAMKSNWVDEPNISTRKEMNLLLKQTVSQLESVPEPTDSFISQKRLILPSFVLEATKPDQLYQKESII